MSSTQIPTRPDESPSRREAGFRGFLRSSVIFTLGPVLGRALGLLVVPFVVAALGPDDFGRFELLSTAGSSLAALLLVGLDNSSISLFHRPGRHDRQQVFPSALSIAAALGLIAALLVFVARSWLSTTVLGGSGYGTAVSMAGLYGLFTVIGVVARTGLRVKERAGQHSLVSASSSLSTTLFVIVVLVANGGLREILISHVGGAILGMVLALWLARDLFGSKPDAELSRSMMALGGPQLIAVAAVAGGEFLHRLLLSEIAGTGEVGVLGIGARIAAVLAFVVIGLQAGWHPRVFDLLERDDGFDVVAKDAKRIGAMLCGAALACSVLAAPGVAFLGRSEFVVSDTKAVAGWMVVAMAGTGFFQLATLHSITEKKFGDTTKALVTGLVCGVLVAIVAVPSSGQFGGAVGTAIAFASTQWIAAGTGWFLAGRGHSLRLPIGVARPAVAVMPACIVITSATAVPIKAVAAMVALGVLAMQLWGTRPQA